MLVKDIMQRAVRTVEPGLPLTKLEREFMAQKVSGFPVVESGRLVGIVSRSDIVRQLCVEQTVAESISDYHHQVSSFDVDPVEEIDAVAGRVGRRLETLHVRDVMVKRVVSISPDAGVRELAELLSSRRLHRIIVTEADGQLVGIVSSNDVVRLVAEGKLA